MKRTMVYLPDELHKNLKRLSVERETSMAALLREAALALLAEECDDIEEARRALKEFRENPAAAVSLDEYHDRRKKR